MNEKPANNYIFEDQLEEPTGNAKEDLTEEDAEKIAEDFSKYMQSLPLEEKEFISFKQKPEIPVKVASVFKPYYTEEELERVEELTEAYYQYIRSNDQLPFAFFPASLKLLKEIEKIHRKAEQNYIEKNILNYDKVLKDTEEALKEVNETFCSNLVEVYRTVMENVFGKINWDNAKLNGEYLEIKQSDIASPIIVVPAKPVDESKRKKAKVVKVKATAKEESKEPIVKVRPSEEETIHRFKSDRTVSVIGIIELLRLPKSFYSYAEYKALEYSSNEDLYIDPDQLGFEDLEKKDEQEPEYSVFKNEVISLISNTIDKYYPSPINTDELSFLNISADKEIEEVIKTVYPSNVLLPVDKLSASYNEIIPGKELSIPTGIKDTKEIIMLMPDALPEEIESKLTPQSRRIMGAFATYFELGVTVISPQMLYRTMTGNKEARLTDKIEKEIEDEVIKLSTMWAKVDITELAKYYNVPDESQLKYSGPLLQTFKLEEVTLNGNVSKSAYKILSMPVFIASAKFKKQIESIPTRLLDVPVSSTSRNLDITYFLLERIKRIEGNATNKKAKYQMSNNILYSDIYAIAGIKEDSKSKKTQESRTRDTVKLILDYWKKKDLFKDYKVNKKGTIPYYSITIIL